MKFALLLLALAPGAVLSASSESLFELSRHPDAGNAVSQLSHMMAAAQQKLSLVERHHGKVVKQVRKQAAAFLQAEAQVYGDALNSYSAEVMNAAAELRHAVEVAKENLKAAQAATAARNTNDWRDPSVMEKAKLNAEVASADRAVKKADRQRTSQLREAKERSEETLESEGQKLGLKLGDMSPIVDKAKESMAALADKAPAAKEAAKVVAAKTVNLKAVQDDLAKALAKNRGASADAQKKLDSALSKVDKEAATKRAKIEEGLQAAQNDEIKKVLGSPAKKAAPKKKVAPATKATPPAKAAAAVKKDAALLKVEQDPCAGCTTGLAQAFQTCAMKHGNPCAETNAAGIVGSGPGAKKDIGCCMKKEKHDRCLQCSSMDCAHNTCNVNKKYYNTYTIAEKFDDKKAMKKAGWGK